MKNVLVTGKPGVGKTTLLQKVAKEVQGKVGGFYTQEIRVNQRRTGFAIRTFSGKEGLLAHVAIKSPFRVGKYRINLIDLDTIAVPEIEQALADGDLIVVDEIGKMELFSKKFQKAVMNALDSPRPFLATIMHGSTPFADQIKSRADVCLFEVNKENRNATEIKLVERINNQIVKKI